MKTWKEFIESRSNAIRPDWALETINEMDYKQIQLSAYKAGGRAAANKTKSYIQKDKIDGEECGCERCEQTAFIHEAILTHFDNLKELP